MTVQKLFQDGRLSDAIEACTEEVKRVPTAVEPRYLLAQFLCFAGELERADKQLDTLGMQCEDRRQEFGLMRHLIRAATAREFFEQGRVPEFSHPPSEYVKLCLEASVCLREDNPTEALELLSKADDARPEFSGECDGQPFDDLQDGDNLTAWVFEALTGNGKYYWVPFDCVVNLELQESRDPIDFLWRAARLEMVGGAQGVVYLPQLYFGSSSAADEQLRLGRTTEWQEGQGQPLRGVGHRIMLFSEGHRAMAEINNIALRHGQSSDA